jgi:hypothetical protein
MLHHARPLAHWLYLFVVFVGVLEVCARIDDSIRWKAPLIGSYTHSMLWVHDSLGFRNRPGVRFEKWQINSHGFRGPEVAVEKRPDVVRVGLVGASETFGLFESEGMEYPAQLQAKLDWLAPGRFEVVNFAVAGMGLPTMRGYYETTVSRFRPDIVVLYPSPSFYLDTAEPIAVGPSQSPGERSARPILRLAEKSRTLLKRFVPRAAQAQVKSRSIRRARVEHDQSWVWDDVPVDRMRLFRNDLGELVHAVHASGAQIVLVTHANRFPPNGALTAEDRYHLRSVLSLFPRASDAALLRIDDKSNTIIRDAASDRNAHLIDAAAAMTGNPAYFADYAHFTDIGAARMAEVLAADIVLMLQRE